MLKDNGQNRLNRVLKNKKDNFENSAVEDIVNTPI